MITHAQTRITIVSPSAITHVDGARHVVQCLKGGDAHFRKILSPDAVIQHVLNLCCLAGVAYCVQRADNLRNDWFTE